MKINLDWLATCFTTKPNWDDVLYRLTQAGIEFEGYQADGSVVELKITPNRGDCLSLRGLAREIASLTELKVVGTAFPELQTPSNLSLPAKRSNLPPSNLVINNLVPDLCKRYSAVIITDIDNSKQLPEYITQNLNDCGIRSISPLVDLTNFVMLELGQPLHAYDLAKLGGNAINIRLANSTETLLLLDGTTASLTDDTLVICNSSEQPVAIAGVMGGMDVNVTEQTTSIILESAFFVPEIIAGKSKYYKVVSDAGYRFERGVDYELNMLALERAAELIIKYLGGIPSHPARYTADIHCQKIKLKATRINDYIGQNIPLKQVENILTNLGFGYSASECKVTSECKISAIYSHELPVLEITVPSFRFDINQEEDIIEEIARVYGYDNIKPLMPVMSYTVKAPDTQQIQTNNLKNLLVNLGYNEIIGYAFLEPRYAELLKLPEVAGFVHLQNPIAGLSILRTTLIADLIKVLEYNVNRGHKHLRIFELARVFHGETEDKQPLKLAGLIWGDYADNNWAITQANVDFFDLKHDVECLLSGVADLKFVPVTDNPLFHGGICAKITVASEIIGMMGKLHPSVGQQLGLNELPYIFELDIANLLKYKFNHVIKVAPPSKFQKVTRDLAFTIAKEVNVGEVVALIKQKSDANLREVSVFDVYQGDKVGIGYKSIALNLIFQADRTLVDTEINALVDGITCLVQDNFKASIRS